VKRERKASVVALRRRWRPSAPVQEAPATIAENRADYEGL
jgi:hypothetical protein